MNYIIYVKVLFTPNNFLTIGKSTNCLSKIEPESYSYSHLFVSYKDTVCLYAIFDIIRWGDASEELQGT